MPPENLEMFERMGVALGITEGGEKDVLGVWRGATENTTVVKRLLEDLVDRRLDLKQRYLVVIDGSKALRAGVPGPQAFTVPNIRESLQSTKTRASSHRKVNCVISE